MKNNHHNFLEQHWKLVLVILASVVGVINAKYIQDSQVFLLCLIVIMFAFLMWFVQNFDPAEKLEPYWKRK